jgi:arylsulfatase A-like enzyme/cytochrome c-type biogenesis protein CcmH/NrfG
VGRAGGRAPSRAQPSSASTDGIPPGRRAPTSGLARRSESRSQCRLFWLFALVFVVITACRHRDPSTLRIPTGTPIVLISIDTLRSDHLPAYGYKGVDTPNIDALRRESILYAHAYTPTPLTLPAHTSLLTGVLPETHGIRDNVGYALDPERRRRNDPPLLTALLKSHGYATAAAISAYVLQGKSGLEESFDLYEDGVEFQSGRGLGQLQRAGGETVARLLPWLRAHAAEPFFVWLHLYEPHTPYDPPPAYAARAKSPYDGEIAAADAIVGDLFAELRRLDRWDGAVVVLLSDHGEGLGDHGEDEHGVLLYREAIQVPLLLKLPGAELGGSTADAAVSLVDVAPTIGELLGLPRPAAWSRPSLLAGLSKEKISTPTTHTAYSETFYPRLHFGWSDLAAAVDGRFHLVMGPHPELYDLADDPGERRNLLPGERRAFASLRQEIDRHDRHLRPPGDVDAESRRAMAALGYVGTASSGALDGPLPDPRAHLGELRDLKVGFAALSRKDPAGAAAAFRRVVAGNPGMVDAWEFLGHALEREERAGEALAAYQEALRRSGGSPHVAMAAASLLLAEGRIGEAEEHARLALAAHPSFAHGVLAQAALQRHDLDAAEREARLAAGAGQKGAGPGSGDRVGPPLTLAAVQHARGRYEEALATADAALAAWRARTARDPDLVRGGFLLRGRILADLGRAAEAEAAFRQEIELFPGDPPAYTNLALLYALTGRGDRVSPLLRTLIEGHPSPRAYAEVAKTLRVMKLAPQAEQVLAQGRRLYPGDPQLRAGAG